MFMSGFYISDIQNDTYSVYLHTRSLFWKSNLLPKNLMLCVFGHYVHPFNILFGIRLQV